MKELMKRCGVSFVISSICGLFINICIEIIIRNLMGNESFQSISPEFLALFPSVTMAVYVNILLYGVIGATFAGMTLIYEIDRLGYIIQNLLYYIATGIVWVPIVIVMWKLYQYPEALVTTIAGFVVTYVIMTVMGYKNKKQEIETINLVLETQMKNQETEFEE